MWHVATTMFIQVYLLVKTLKLQGVKHGRHSLKDPRKIYWKYIQSKPEYVLDMPKMPYKS
jgi:hypothetical protein